jgi:hypothetical protein
MLEWSPGLRSHGLRKGDADRGFGAWTRAGSYYLRRIDPIDEESRESLWMLCRAHGDGVVSIAREFV